MNKPDSLAGDWNHGRQKSPRRKFAGTHERRGLIPLSGSGARLKSGKGGAFRLLTCNNAPDSFPDISSARFPRKGCGEFLTDLQGAEGHGME